MTIKLKGDSGLVIESADGAQSVDLMSKRDQLIDAINNITKLTSHLIPSLDGTINTVEESIEALKNGTLAVNAFGGRTIVRHVNDGIVTVYLWNVEEQELHKLGLPVGNYYIDFHGDNYIHFDNNGDVFNFNKSWFISVGCLTMHANGAFQTLFSAGDNTFNWLAGGGNYGIYLDDRVPVTQGGSSRKNTWSDPELTRVMLNYDHTTKNLEYWLGAMGSNPTVKILDIEQYQGDPAQLYETPTELCVSKAMSGTGGVLGGMNELIAGTEYLTNDRVQAIYSGDGVDWSSYPEITIHAGLGEGNYPNVDVTGTVLSNGIMSGTGNADDFVPIV
jgi:hypothetical protein